ncbi:putative stress response protein YsnF [Candidatus Nitrososphaera gargensis Ga9.2]|uniref:Putative stress response protein YsnF n=1 Tax=Nitrososphaera gargensis (strain Ga9.2) TaxID=1237085 RepID=K0IHC9_NITGG|nr:YsnF/AvaK domain-containing protein [Candidatus Nitrososphaera gargensis]AFU57167.1 putative stress response protein YsnF [Candidatus Nitrososphaera gargensis Ga9.2]
MANTESIAWDDVVKKEARGAVDDSDFGEVQEIGQHYVLTQKGVMKKEKFYVPKYLVQGYDGKTLWFDASEDQLQGWRRDTAPSYDEYSSFRKPEAPKDIETRIPVIEERLQVSKRESTDEATITKRPVTENKTVEVPVTHEELTVERRPATDTTQAEGPVSSDTEIKVPLRREEVEVTKKPYVKEEVVIKKEPVTETQTVSDTVTSEQVDVEGKKRRQH